MNTSVYTKRLLKGLAVLAAVCVSTQVSAAFSEAQDFEGFSAGYEITNDTSWAASGSDISTVIATNYAYTAATMPLSQTYPATVHTKVLKLDTQGDQLTDDVSVTAEDVVYIDQMAYLVPSDDAPSLDADTSIQFAVYMNSASNLVVYHGGSNGLVKTHTAITSTNVIPNTWVRLTITADYTTGNGFGGINYDWFKVQVDGSELTSAEGYTTPLPSGTTPPTTGPWFQSANKGVAAFDELSGISYMGTGMIDDLLVTTVAPTFSGGTPTVFFTITSVVGANGSIDTDLSFDVESGGTTQIVYTADTWYEIASLDVDGSPVGAAVGLMEYTNTYPTVGADISNNVTFVVQRKEGAPATWYGGVLGLGLDPADDGDAYNLFQEYVAGLDPTVNAAFEITSLTKDASNYLIITWDGADSPAVATRLTVEGSATVGGASSPIAGGSVYSSGEWTWTSTAPVPDTVKFLFLSADETAE